MPKKTLRRGPHSKVESIVTHRQRCESGDHGRGLPNKAGIDPQTPLTGQSAQLRSAETNREVPTDHEAAGEQARERSDEASHVSAGCAPGSRGETVQATTQRSFGLASQALRTRRGPRCAATKSLFHAGRKSPHPQRSARIGEGRNSVRGRLGQLTGLT